MLGREGAYLCEGERGLTCVRVTEGAYLCEGERERAYMCEGERGLTCVREREGGLPVFNAVLQEMFTRCLK